MVCLVMIRNNFYNFKAKTKRGRKNMFKTETHIHTSEVSACSRKRAKEMIRLYKEAGYSTVFISDHFQTNSLDVLGDIPWSEKMAIFLSGYY